MKRDHTDSVSTTPLTPPIFNVAFPFVGASNLSERVGTECDAQTGAEVSKFAENLLTRLKCILVKAGEDGTVEATSITSGGNSPSMSRKTDGMFLSSP